MFVLFISLVISLLETIGSWKFLVNLEHAFVNF